MKLQGSSEEHDSNLPPKLLRSCWKLQKNYHQAEWVAPLKISLFSIQDEICDDSRDVQEGANI